MADIYVLDSNVLLSDPHAIYEFPEAEVVIPGVVIEEIDAKKHGGDGTAYNAGTRAVLADRCSSLSALVDRQSPFYLLLPS